MLTDSGIRNFVGIVDQRDVRPPRFMNDGFLEYR